jgi:uroporphyrinogen-III decarboxylase
MSKNRNINIGRIEMQNSRERLMKVLRGEKPDRVPISLYEFDGFYDSWIHDYPEYVNILKYAEGKTDKMCFWAPSDNTPMFLYGVIDERAIKRETWQKSNSTFSKTTVETPKGEITLVSRQDEGLHTSWTIKTYCDSEEDAKKVLSLPYEPWCPNVDSFFSLDTKLGGSGILMGDIPDALCLTVELFGLSKFLNVYVRNKPLVFELLDFFHERICNYLEHLLKKGAVTIYRICGPEYATPPYLHPREFDKLVKSYDVDLVNLLHRYGGYARLHSHGKVKKVLPAIREIGIDAVDPLEPPPDGDVELCEAREILGAETVLIGNIEERLFEIGSRTDIEKQVKKAIEQVADTGGFILCPTAMPISTPLKMKIQQNIIHYINCGLKYGQLKI